MPDILTRADVDLRDAAQALISANNCNYDREVMRSLGLFDRLWKALESHQNAENVSDYGQEASEGSQRSLTQSGAAPETIRISLPALRAVILTLLDDGDRAMAVWLEKAKQPWDFYDDDEDVANNARMRFCVQIEQCLRQLPTRG